MPHGVVEAPSGATVAGARIGIFNERTRTLVSTVESDVHGLYSFPQLPPGRYRLVAAAAGLCPASVPVRITGGFVGFNIASMERSLDLHLRPATACSVTVH